MSAGMDDDTVSLAATMAGDDDGWGYTDRTISDAAILAAIPQEGEAVQIVNLLRGLHKKQVITAYGYDSFAGIIRVEVADDCWDHPQAADDVRHHFRFIQKKVTDHGLFVRTTNHPDGNF